MEIFSTNYEGFLNFTTIISNVSTKYAPLLIEKTPFVRYCNGQQQQQDKYCFGRLWIHYVVS